MFPCVSAYIYTYFDIFSVVMDQNKPRHWQAVSLKDKK